MVSDSVSKEVSDSVSKKIVSDSVSEIFGIKKVSDLVNNLGNAGK